MEKAETRVAGYQDLEGAFYCESCADHAREVDEVVMQERGGTMTGAMLTVADLREDKRDREAMTGDFAAPRRCEDCEELIAPRELYPRG
jgi:hypothetical protein